MSALPPIADISWRQCMSALCQKRTFVHSLDHLVGARKQCRRHGEAQHPGDSRVDYQLELGRLHDRQACRLGALEDAAHIDAVLTMRVRQACSVAYQPAHFGI